MSAHAALLDRLRRAELAFLKEAREVGDKNAHARGMRDALEVVADYLKHVIEEEEETV